jgi:hypothetical protein
MDQARHDESMERKSGEDRESWRAKFPSANQTTHSGLWRRDSGAFIVHPKYGIHGTTVIILPFSLL